ncbi:hypothetical protein BDN72DRAFT_847230 [Pluteus cervinus]|uniref:Uncharacterized protein n=1 Tax=Pluteus cervinus TaxID=181527 RepID=A0ACD3AEU5_9AGAR|nr:hypothetical protein BDN72DRAFT_847230 [Pluteus cervinus]
MENVGDPIEERDRLDAKIRELELALAELKRKRNSLSPVSRISSDILVYIFTYIQGEDHEHILACSPPNARSSASISFRIRATHVCSQWRRIALSAAMLWTDITFQSGSDAYMAEMLQRSRGAPLTISVFPDEKGDRADGHDSLLLEVLLTEKHRIRSLHIHASVSSIDEKLNLAELGTGPIGKSILETLCISAPFPLFVGFLKYSRETLRYLRISRFRSEGFAGGTIICPKLSRVNLQGSPGGLGELLTKVLFPPACAVSLECRYGRSDSGFEEILPFLRRLCEAKAAAGRSLEHLHFSELQSNRNESPRANVSINFLCDFYQTPDISLNLNIDIPSPRSRTVIKNILSCSILSQIRNVTFIDELYFHSTTWEFLAGECHNVRSIIIHGFEELWPLCRSLDIHNQLQDNADNEATGDPLVHVQLVPHPFFNLETLEFHGLYLDEDTCGHLRNALENRSRVGIPLSGLVLNNVQLEVEETSFLHSLLPFVQGNIICMPGYEAEESNDGSE